MKAASLALALVHGAVGAVPATAAPEAVAVPASPSASTQQTASPSAPQPRVVIAAIELAAMNMYHEWFHLGGALYPEKAPSSVDDAVLREFGIDSEHIIRLTRTGDLQTDMKADIAQFDAVEYGKPYWYEGTNVIGVSFAPDRTRLRPDLNPFGAAIDWHATSDVAMALLPNPEAIVVAVQADNAKRLTSTKEEFNAAIPAEVSKPLGEAWAFNHPAVDIVSTSYGNRYNAPYGDDLVDGYKGVVEGGKMHFGSPDNQGRGRVVNDQTVPSGFGPITGHNTSGPWWSIAVGGYYEGTDPNPDLDDESDNEYRDVGTGQSIDFVADLFHHALPNCQICTSGTQAVQGTSLTTQYAAGTVSSLILEARRAANHKGGIRLSTDLGPLMVKGRGHALTVWQVRRAMEEAAYYPGDKLSDDPRKWDAIPGAPWLSHGWGAITPDPQRGFVPKALAHLGISGVPSPPKPVEACAFQTAGIRLRQEYWNRVAPFSDSRGKDADPFLPCFKQPGL